MISLVSSLFFFKDYLFLYGGALLQDFFFNSNDFFFQLKMKKNKRNFVTESCKTPWLWKTSTSCPHLTSPPINHSLPAFLPPLSSLSTSLSSAPHYLIFFFSLVLLRLSVAALMHSHRPFIHADVLFIKADVFHPPPSPSFPPASYFCPAPAPLPPSPWSPSPTHGPSPGGQGTPS